MSLSSVEAKTGMQEHKIRYWQSEGCNFFRFDCAPQGLVLENIFHEDVFIGAVERSTWISKQTRRTYRETEKSLIVRDAEQIFSVKTAAVDKKGGIVRGLLIPRNKLQQLYRQETGKKLPLLDFCNPIIDSRQFRNAFVKLHRATEKHRGRPEGTHSLARFIAKLADHRSKSAVPAPKKKCLSRDIVDHIHAHYDKNIKLNELVKITSNNPFVLTRQFRKDVGCTPNNYLHMYRIACAKKFISKGIELSQVANLCGFADQSHLTRCFKRLVGVTPGRFLPLE
jgi:AraC-like DNA-binding protein